MSTVTAWLARRKLDVDAAVLGLVVAGGLFPLRFLTSQIYVRTIPIVLGVACVLYLLATRGESGAALPTLSPAATRLLPALVLLGVAGLVALSLALDGRSRPFYALAGAVGTLLIVQAVFADDREFDAGLYLLQLVALALAVRLAALYATPGLVGIDAWTHRRLAASVRAEGSLAAIAGDKHYAAPFYHLLVVGTSLLADVTLREALSLSLGVAVPVSCLLVYATTRLLLAARWAALAATLYVLGDYVVEWGIHLIPTSMGLAFFLGVVYALVRVTRTDYRLRDFGLLVGLSVAVVLTHQVSSFIMMVLICAGVVAQATLGLELFSPSPLDADVFRAVPTANLVGLAVFDAGLVTFTWSLTPYRGDSFLETVLSYFSSALASSAGFLDLAGPSGGGDAAAAGGGEPGTLAVIATYVDVLGFLLLLCGTVVGCLYVLRRERATQSAYTLLVASVVMLAFVLGLPLFGVRSFIPQRWFAFLYAPMAVLAAVGVRALADGLGRRTFVACLLVLAAVYPVAMVTSSHGTIDAPAFPDQQARLSYTGPELAAVDTIGRMTGSPDSRRLRPDQVLHTDHPYQTVFARTGAYPAAPATVADGEPVAHDLVVYRRYQSDGASYFLDADGNGRVRDVPPRRICRPDASVLYANGDVRLCASGPA